MNNSKNKKIIIGFFLMILIPSIMNVVSYILVPSKTIVEEFIFHSNDIYEKVGKVYSYNISSSSLEKTDLMQKGIYEIEGPKGIVKVEIVLERENTNDNFKVKECNQIGNIKYNNY